ncbi:hypothetical protein B0H13DRAFT_2319792 [Mycena leptocephala]|nr:hypothetical protein B0H13DRAFT_2319792 [Mycena leptocephala]
MVTVRHSASMNLILAIFGRSPRHSPGFFFNRYLRKIVPLMLFPHNFYFPSRTLLKLVLRMKTAAETYNGQLFLPSSEPALIGSFRYFNTNDLASAFVLPVPFLLWRFIATLTPVDYHIMGDIISLIPLGSPENFDLCHQSLITMCPGSSNMMT